MTVSLGTAVGRSDRGVAVPPEIIKQLQRDLRRLGYLRTGIDGIFGPRTEQAVKALQWDLLHNEGSGPDGRALVRLVEYNRGRIRSVTGTVDESLVEIIREILAEPRIPKLPSSPEPAKANAALLEQLDLLAFPAVPPPFLRAMLQQESGLKHYREPTLANEDSFVLVGLDCNGPEPYVITSRGYGVGQLTLFHHPPTPEEAASISDPAANLRHAVQKLQEKFERFVMGPTPATQAQDRLRQVGVTALRRCRYLRTDPRYLRDCRNCLASAPKTDVRLPRTRHHPASEYKGVPLLAHIGCDWPYAARRYNGDGTSSYHYQAKVLLNLLNG